MKQESVALRAKKVGIATIMVLAMIVSGLAVFPTAPGVIGQDNVGGEFGGDFRIGIKELPIPNTFNPLVDANEPSLQMIDLLYDSLGKVDPYSLMLEPWIAKEWNVDPDNQSVVTVILRNDVKWHDSTSLSVNDVDYTFGPTGYNLAYLADTILDPDNNTITFLLDGPNALFFSEMLLMKLIPQGFTSTSTEENGCGPFFLNTSATIEDSSWTLQAFDEYFNGRPYVDSFVYKYYSEGFYDSNTGTGAGFDLLNGTLEFIGWDLTTNETFSTVIEILRPNNVTEVTMANPLDDYTFVNNEPGMHYKYIGMNNARDHVLNDVNVRLAISYCLKKASLAKYDVSGGLIVADSIMSPMVKPWFNDSLEKHGFDQSIANSILDNAGYMQYDSLGFRQLPNGTHFSLDLLLPTQAEDISAPAMGDNLVNWLEEGIGINVTIIPLTEDERMQRIINNDFDLYLSTETRGSINPNFLELLFHSDNIATNDNLLNFQGRAREMYGMVSVNYSDATNTTLVGQMNHTNVFNDTTSDIIAYRNDELWGVTETQLVWTSNGTYPTLPLLNDTIDDGYRIYRNRTVLDEKIWKVTLHNVSDDPILDATAAKQVNNESMVTVNTTYKTDMFVGASNRTIVTNDVVTVNATGPDELGNNPVENGTLELWKEGNVDETVAILNVGARDVLLVDADDPADGWGLGYEGIVKYYQWAIENTTTTSVTVWDVYGNNGPIQGKPDAAAMGPYNIVIWIPGSQSNFGAELDPADETEIGLYLTNGGNFHLANIMWTDYTDGGSFDFNPGDFAYDYLGIDDFNPWCANEWNVSGVPGDAAYDGWYPAPQDWTKGVGWILIYGGAPPLMSDDITVLAPGATTGIINDDGFGTQGNSGVRVDGGNFKTVFCGFPFETLSFADANEFIARTLNWFIPPGFEGQLANGANANETIVDWHIWDDTVGAYLQNTTDFTLDPTSGFIKAVNDLSANTIIAFYNYTTDMVEDVDYQNLTTWNYLNGMVNLTIPINPVEDTVRANYTRYNAINGGTLPITPGMKIITNPSNNFTLYWQNDTLGPIEWASANYSVDNVTGLVTFTTQLGPGENVTANYSCFDPTYYGYFSWPLNFGGLSNESIVDVINLDLRKWPGGATVPKAGYNLNADSGIVDILSAGFLSYDETLTVGYWYYDPVILQGPVYNLAHGVPTDGNATTVNQSISQAFVQVYNVFTDETTNYTADQRDADLISGTFELAAKPGDIVTANYQYYHPDEIFYEYDLVYPIISEGLSAGTLEVFLSGSTVPKNQYTIDLVTGRIILDNAQVTLGPHDNLTATYCYFNDLVDGSDYTLVQESGMLTLINEVDSGDRVLADYTYATFIMTDNKTGKLQIITNFDVNNDTLAMSFDYKKLDELVELANMQMDYETQAKYFKEVQGFLAEEVPCVPLFFYKVANAYNNSRYEGWDSTVGGIINFHSFIHLRNKINGDMLVSMSARFDYVTMDNDLDLEIKVEDLDGNTIPDVIFEFDGSGDFGESNFEWQDTDEDGAFDPDETGAYVVTYTAPTTTVSRSITITANAIRSSYVKGSGEFQVTVHPEINEFDIEIMRGTNETVTSIESGSETNIRVTVTDSDTGEAIPDAMVSLSISPLGLGGYLDDVEGTTDSNGEFTTVFGAVNVTVDTTFQISVTISKNGYYDGTLDTSISVDKDPNIKGPGSGFLGLPAPSFLIIIMLLAGMSVFYAGRRRRR